MISEVKTAADLEQTFAPLLLAWFERDGRKDLPWQQDINPYRVWISEIMLQQTQVATVIPYYERFMHQFPDVAALAAAPLDAVLAQWSGLGYYARARNLHRTAVIIQDQYEGEFPRDIDAVMALPGIGRSTAGAILSLACQQVHAILDGNVKRVLARLLMLTGWPGQSAVADILWHYAQTLTPQQNTASYNQAIMDLGAIVCTRSQPQCSICPVATLCLANQYGCQLQFPHKKPRKPLPVRQTTMVMLLNHRHEVLLERRPNAGIWGGLLSFPELAPHQTLDGWCQQHFGITVEDTQSWPVVRHTFTHFHLDITPLKVSTKSPMECVMEDNAWVWYKDNKITAGLATPVKRLLDRLVCKEP